MKDYIFHYCKLLLLFIFITNFLFSCKSSRELAYFNNQPEGIYDSKTPVLQQTIVPNDLLSITVSSLNPEATAIFNNSSVSSTPTNGTTVRNATGYLVEQDGSIQFPLLGRIQAAGLTKTELAEFLRKTLEDKKLLIDPIVVINFLNYRVTVLGEVNHPTVVTVPNEKISLLEAIGMAGDLTLYAKRENVLLIREENGKRLLKRINLNSGDIFNSPYYYLKSNDIVYAEPNKTKAFTTSSTKEILPLVFSFLTLITLVLYRLKIK
ncbi:polysaccharide biosynthesis/export family protein [Segetibacter koreensis]|uniref:polysaccharide biosynthesis/export family protein n=1 Tax=Segetibacter koreensis TaxID=398037 RepID=UPI00037A39B1|nr:polysaccharide biosynthesis/export family protein [Segetibacter koreensis]